MQCDASRLKLCHTQFATLVPCLHSAQHYMFVQTLSLFLSMYDNDNWPDCAVHTSTIRGPMVDLPVKHSGLRLERSLSAGVRDRDSCSAARLLRAGISCSGGTVKSKGGNGDLPSKSATGAASPARPLYRQGVLTLWSLPGRRQILGRAGAECEGVSCDEQLPITLRWSRPLRRRAEQGERLASSGRHAKLSRAGSPAGAQLVCTAKARGEAGSLRVSAEPYQSRQLRCPGPSQARWTLKTPAGCRSLPETTSRPYLCVSVE